MKRVALGLTVLALLGACSDDDEGAETGSTTTTEASTTSTSEAEATTTTSTTEPTVEADPVDAAEAFMAIHFPGDRTAFSEFRQGDSQSGEVDVLRPREGGGGPPLLGSTLLLRQDAGEWIVIGAVNPNVTIEVPENGGEVPAGPITVSGAGRGFEAAITGRAVDADGQVVAEGFGSGGAQADPLPYEIELDLSGVPTGSELVLIAAGGVGLDQDTGEFSVVRVTVGG